MTGLKLSRNLLEYKFYNGEVTIFYDPVDHIYLIDNEEVPSVTTIVKIIDKSAVLINWAVKLTVENILSSVHFPITEEELREIVIKAKSAHRERLEDAGNVGKIAHSYIEAYIKDKLISESVVPLMPLDERAANCFKAALDWESKHNVRWICTERKVYSRAYKYAGTLDGLALVDSCTSRKCCPVEFKDRLSLIDWKSSNYLYNEYLFQTAAYQYAYEEETGETIADRWIIRLGKDDGEFQAWHMESNYEEDVNAFFDCLGLTKAIKSVTMRMKEFKALNKPNRVRKNVKAKVKNLHTAENES